MYIRLVLVLQINPGRVQTAFFQIEVVDERNRGVFVIGDVKVVIEGDFCEGFLLAFGRAFERGAIHSEQNVLEQPAQPGHTAPAREHAATVSLATTNISLVILMAKGPSMARWMADPRRCSERASHGVTSRRLVNLCCAAAQPQRS